MVTLNNKKQVFSTQSRVFFNTPGNLAKKKTSRQKYPLDNSNLVKIYPGKVSLTSPRVKLSRQRESKTYKEISYRNSSEFPQYKISHEEFTPLYTSIFLENSPRTKSPSRKFVLPSPPDKCMHASQ